MVDEISEIFKKFTDEDNEIVRRFIERDPDGGRFIFDDVDMGFYKRESNQMNYYIIIDFGGNAVGNIHTCLSLRKKHHQEKIEKISQKC